MRGRWAPWRWLRAAVRLYQVAVSPLLGPRCRFHPTCSHYACQALEEHGALHGGWLTVRRIARCHPFSRGGLDPVPLPVPVPVRASAAPAHRDLPTR